MNEPSLHFLDVPGPKALHASTRRIAWWEWNRTGHAHPAHVVVCVHGLTRQGRDFDVLADALSEHCRVLCVDVAGRGHSDWLEDPLAYQVPTYAADLAALLQHLRQAHAAARAAGHGSDASAMASDPLRIDWVGTSMGGLIAMALAPQPGVALGRLVLNDVGPVLQWDALKRIGTYVGRAPVFATEQAAADALWQVSSSFGPHTPAQWLALTRPMLRAARDGWTLHYDPRIGLPFRQMTEGPDEAALQRAAQDGEKLLWSLYDAIPTPTLLLRGANSDLLSAETARQMAQRGPRARLVEIDGVGHAPTLIAPDQVQLVRDFLLGA